MNLGELIDDRFAIEHRLGADGMGETFCARDPIPGEAVVVKIIAAETVLAMVETRLARLPLEARRVLRAASVFGEVCWDSGVTLLLDRTLEAAAASAWLARLVEQELLVEGGIPWTQGALSYHFGTLMAGRIDDHMALIARLPEVTPAPEAAGSFAMLLLCGIATLDSLGQLRAATALEEPFRALVAARGGRDRISDPDYRRSFLEAVPENARTLALARAWLPQEAS